LKDNNNGIIVLPTQGEQYGFTYEKWTEKWWQWALSIPESVNPLLDATGKNCHQGQNGPVWFLGGTLKTDKVVRRCRISAEKALFFPVINEEISEGEALYIKDVYELVPIVKDDMDRVICKQAYVDGFYLKGLDEQRVASQIFQVNLPADNVYRDIYHLQAGETNVASDGYWILLKPLPPGEHVLRFSGYFIGRDGYCFSTEVTYLLTIE